MTILELMKKKKISVSDLAKELDISTSQIYKWNKEGISRNNKHYKKLQSILPGLKPREPTLRQNGTEDRRYNSGKHKKDFKLTPHTETENETKPGPEFKSTLFPKIIKRRQT